MRRVVAAAARQGARAQGALLFWQGCASHWGPLFLGRAVTPGCVSYCLIILLCCELCMPSCAGTGVEALFNVSSFLFSWMPQALAGTLEGSASATQTAASGQLLAAASKLDSALRSSSLHGDEARCDLVCVFWSHAVACLHMG